MVTPLFKLDSHETWHPLNVEDSLSVYGYRWTDDRWLHGDEMVYQIDLPQAITEIGLQPTLYHRVVAGGSVWWHQFWSWWLYNPKMYAGFGAHEGDWEMVQVGCRDFEGNVPILMTLSQHDGGEKREYWRVPLEDGRPAVCVARDSHANYFEPTRSVTDQVDGAGEVLEPEILEFGTWAEWDGKWGNSDNSPGPLSTRRAWMAPHAWHGQARG